MDKLNTDPIKYEVIANKIIKNRDATQKNESDDQLYKMFKTIINLHENAETLTLEIRERLTDRGLKVRYEIEGNKL